MATQRVRRRRIPSDGALSSLREGRLTYDSSKPVFHKFLEEYAKGVRERLATRLEEEVPEATGFIMALSEKDLTAEDDRMLARSHIPEEYAVELAERCIKHTIVTFRTPEDCSRNFDEAWDVVTEQLPKTEFNTVSEQQEGIQRTITFLEDRGHKTIYDTLHIAPTKKRKSA